MVLLVFDENCWGSSVVFIQIFKHENVVIEPYPDNETTQLYFCTWLTLREFMGDGCLHLQLLDHLRLILKLINILLIPS